MNQSWKETLQRYKKDFSEYWNEMGRNRKFLYIGIFVLILVSLSAFTFIASRPEYVPLYTNDMSQREIGEIKAELDKQGYADYKLENNGTRILVPSKDAADLLVSLASQGLPKNGNISNEVFSQNMTFGATDRQLNVIEREAMQNEIASLIKRIEGIKNADVVITLPEESVFIRPENEDKASASIVVEIEPGAQLGKQQIRALYYLVSKSVKNLPLENVVIMNQYSEMLELDEDNKDNLSVEDYELQRKITGDIEKDISRNLYSLLGTIMGQDKVLVHSFVKVNFDKVKSQENLVQPVDEENKQGIAISAEKISKSYNGEGSPPGGVVGTGPSDIPAYPGGTGTNGNQNYEELQNRVNYEVNRINKDIVQSPYQIEDLTINVGIEPPNPQDPASFTPAMEANVKNILGNVVRTALGDKNLSQEDIDNRITVFPRAFSGKKNADTGTNSWLGNLNPTYMTVGIAVIVIASLALFFGYRRKRTSEMEEEWLAAQAEQEPHMDSLEQEETEEAFIRKQLEKMAKDRPEDFVNLLRSWIAGEE